MSKLLAHITTAVHDLVARLKHDWEWKLHLYSETNTQRRAPLRSVTTISGDNRTSPAPAERQHPETTHTELFFDLIFVVVIIQVLTSINLQIVVLVFFYQKISWGCERYTLFMRRLAFRSSSVVIVPLDGLSVAAWPLLVLPSSSQL